MLAYLIIALVSTFLVYIWVLIVILLYSYLHATILYHKWVYVCICISFIYWILCKISIVIVSMYCNRDILEIMAYLFLIIRYLSDFSGLPVCCLMFINCIYLICNQCNSGLLYFDSIYYPPKILPSGYFYWWGFGPLWDNDTLWSPGPQLITRWFGALLGYDEM